MIRTQLVEDCLDCARSMRPDGPWRFVIVDRDYVMIDHHIFQVEHLGDARRWLLDRVQRHDRAPCVSLWAVDDPRLAP